MTRILLSVLVVVAAFMRGPVAAEEDKIVRLDNPASVQFVLKREGFRAKLSTDDSDRPVIDTGIGGTYFSITFYGCENGVECEGLLFLAWFDFDNGFDIHKINAWNLEQLIGRAFLDDDCDPHLDHYIFADRSRRISNFTEEIESWGQALDEFRDFIDFDGDEPETVAVCDGSQAI